MNTSIQSEPPWYNDVVNLGFQQRTCSTFIPREVNKKYCVCNRPKSPDHDSSPTGHLNEVWDWEKHTKPEPTKYYGVVPQSNTPYLRCKIDTNVDQLCLVLLGIWDMHVPSLVVRMMSDTSSMLSPKLEREVLRGISHAAVASDACIITSSYKEDTISQLIGEVIYKSRVKNPEISFSAIGVGKWGNIHDPPTIKARNNGNDTKHPARSGRYTLVPNLTHYIFFDDGTYDSMDTGDFASKLARKISTGARRKIPLVTILVGADLYALELIYNDLKTCIPVVIIDQSGPLATIICKYLKLTENISKSMKNRNQELINCDENGSDNEDDIDTHILGQRVEGTILGEVLNKFGNTRLNILKDLRKLYSILRQKEHATAGKRLPVGELLNLDEEKALAKYLFWFATCLADFRKMIHVFDLNSSNPLQNKIYEAMVQARENLSKTTNKRATTTGNQMRLALHWSIADVTEGHSSISAMDWTDQTKIQQNQTLILNALSKNRLVFVSNFVKLGIDFAILFAPDPKKKNMDPLWNHSLKYLKRLYSEKMRKNTNPLYLLEKIEKKLTFTEETHLDRVLEILVGDFMEPIYQHELSCGSHRVAPERPKDETVREYIYRDLFLWCVLTYRLEMAKIFLSEMDTRICSALIASKILKSLAKYASDHHSKHKLHSEADKFEMYAIECLRCSYLYDREQACELIIRRVNLYGEVTCLQMAIAADDKKFLHEDACNALLTNIWFDQVDPVKKRPRLIINLLTMGISQFFISICNCGERQTKRSEANTITGTSIKPRLTKSSINYTDDYHTDDSIWKHFLHFHNQPIVKYYYTCFGYVLFLLFFSYYMLYAFDPPSEVTPDIHWTEILTIIFVTTMLFEEVRQFYFQDSSSLMSKIRTYFDWTNRSSNLCLVLPAYLLFYVGLILRFVLNDANTFAAARIVMAYDLEIWFIRSIIFIGIAPSLGPRLVMIRKMTTDLLFFVFLIMVVIFGYGITSRAMTAYGTFDFDGRQFFQNVIYPVYYFVFGSFDNELSTLEATPNASTTIATQVLLAFHMLFVNILLINLLIALFTFTVTDVQQQANYVWAYDRCALIRDYYARPPLFPPFTFLISFLYFCRWCWRLCQRKCRGKDEDAPCFKMIPYDSSVDKAWSEFERYSTNDYVRRFLEAQTVAASNIIPTDVAAESSPTNSKLLSMESTVATLHDRVEHIDIRLDGMVDSLDWIMRAMARVKMANDPPLTKPKPRTPVSNRGRQEPSGDVQDNQRPGKRDSLPVSQPPKQESTTVSDTRIIVQDNSNDEENA